MAAPELHLVQTHEGKYEIVDRVELLFGQSELLQQRLANPGASMPGAASVRMRSSTPASSDSSLGSTWYGRSA